MGKSPPLGQVLTCFFQIGVVGVALGGVALILVGVLVIAVVVLSLAVARMGKELRLMS